MTCAACKASLSPGARFCTQCGATLDLACPACRHPVTAEQRFCAQCGHGLAGAAPAQAPTQPPAVAPAVAPAHSAVRSGQTATRVVQTAPGRPDRAESGPLDADRRVITVLFTDVSGFTAMAETLDPEEVTNIINGFFQVLVEPIYRYGGVVDKFIGDAIMALFGAPLAHEDDPVRAVRAAWEMQLLAKEYGDQLGRRTGIALKVRIGLNTGLVVAGSMGSAERADYTVMGDTVNLAQRMEANAAPGKILVTAETYNLTRTAFAFDALPRIQVKGKSQPVEVYEVSGPRPRVERPREDDERILGRELELRRLANSWERARTGRPQVVLLSGDVGIGKSALARKFLAEAAADGQIHCARSLSYEQQEAYSLVASLLLGFLGLPDYAPSAQVSEALARFLAEVSPGEQAAMGLLGHLLSLELDVPENRTLSPRQLRSGAFLALNDLILTLARKRPLVLSLEDLHWADAASLEWLATFFERMSDAEAGLPILVLIQARPDADLPDLALDGRFEFTTVALRPLGREVGLALGALLLGATEGGLPPQVRSVVGQLCDKAEGNPFFLAEMLRNLQEGGVLARQGATWAVARALSEAGLPTSVRSAVAARLDRLAPHLKTVVQCAAVIGRRFDARLLRDVVGHDPTEAVLALIHLKVFGGRGEGEVTFTQGVIQEVAYENLLLAKRRELHRAVGVALEQSLGGDVAKHAADLAYHFVQVEDLARATRYLYLAGIRERASFANAEAVGHLRSALGWLDRSKGEPGLPARHEVLLELATAETALGQLEDAMRHLDDVYMLVPPTPRALRARGDVLERKGDIEAAQQAFEEARKAPDPLEAARATAAMGNIKRRLGLYPEALALSHLAKEQLVAQGKPAEAAIAHGIMGICHHRMGEWDAALREHGEAMRLREQAGDVDGMAKSYNNLGIIAAALGRYAEAHQHYARCLQLFGRLGDRLSMAMVLNNLGDLHLKQGDDGLAERHFREALRLSDKYGNAIESMTALGNLAEVFLKRGVGADALECIDRCLVLAEQTHHGEFGADLRCLRGRALGFMGRLDEARADLASARRLAEEAGNPSFAQVVDRYEAELAAQAGAPG